MRQERKPGRGRRRGRSTGDGRLDGWKEIARYLGKSVKTAQRWEQRYELPVHRLAEPDDRSAASVFAFPREVDAWLQERSETPGSSESSEARSTSRVRRRTMTGGIGQAMRQAGVVVAALVAVGLAYVGYRWLAPAEPALVDQVGDRQLVVVDRDGGRLWSHLFETRFKPSLGEHPAWALVDLDADERDEVVLVRQLPGSVPGPEDGVYAFDDGGRVLWRYDPGRAILIDGFDYRLEFSVRKFLVGRRSEGGPFVVVVATHRPYSPSQVSILDSKGRRIGEYWNMGYVLDALVEDLDGDGDDEVVIGGINDALERPFVAVVEHDLEPSMAPGPVEFPAFLRSQSEASEGRYVVFPHTAAAEVLGVGSWVSGLRPHGGAVLAEVRFDDDSQTQERVYLLDGELRPLRLDFGREFSSIHRSLLDAGEVGVTLEEERQRLLALRRLVP